MNLRNSLIMLAVLLALGGHVYFVEVPHEKKTAEEKKLLTFDKEAVTELALTYPDRLLTVKKNDAGKWRITQPVEADADETTVKNLINAVADAEVKRTLDEIPPDLTVYGLTTPVVKAKLTLKDGKSFPLISFGKDTPVGFSTYAQKEGDAKVMLVPQTLRMGFIKEVKDLRDRTILTFNDDEVKKLEIRGPDREIVLSKADAGWSLEKPAQAKADDTEVKTFLSNLRSLNAQDFLEEPVVGLSEFGLEPPQMSITLTLGADSAQKTVLIGNEKAGDKGAKNRYVKRAELDKPLFLAGEWIWRDLNKNVADFRDKTVAQFTTEQVKQVDVKRNDGESFTLIRGADNKWTIDRTQEGTLREPSLSQFVDELRQLRGFEIAAESPTDLSVYGLDAPFVTVAVSDGEGKKLAAILAGQKGEGTERKTFAMAEGGQTVFGLRDYVFDRLNKKPADFWDKPAEKKEGTPSSQPVTPAPEAK
ncbi:MAG: DUF4340 domain-containing protein [Deltaproteobacteria bacterium]|nr:DUF4340 domain-containing protein [Deltaproteobacteria bacterium]